jgi:hypothetical protein
VTEVKTVRIHKTVWSSQASFDRRVNDEIAKAEKKGWRFRELQPPNSAGNATLIFERD